MRLRIQFAEATTAIWRGETNEFFTHGSVYLGEFLILKQATICNVRIWDKAERKTAKKSFQTHTRDWQFLD